MRTRILAVLIILVFGAVRLPLEDRLAREHRAAYFHGAKLDLDMRQRVGQLGFLAALGGFRALVADLLWLEAHTAWERTEWGRMVGLFDTVCSLQPRCLMFWDTASWHMAYNASVAARENKNQPREALRIKAEREYWKVGEDFLLRGIQNNPDHAVLYDRAGMLYRDKFKDHEKAYEMYEKAKVLPDAMPYVHRFAVYELAEMPGHEREAYDRLKALYNQGRDERLPTLRTKLKNLEKTLGIPPNEGVYRSSVYELLDRPGEEREAYERLRALYEAGGEEHTPEVLSLLQNLEKKLGIPPNESVYNRDAQNPK
jgi:hypothetical protein